MENKEKKYYTYMLRCNNNSIYSGYTDNLERRVAMHNSGKGAKCTRMHLPVELVYFEKFKTKSEAMKRECEFKKYTHAEKEEIILRNKSNH